MQNLQDVNSLILGTFWLLPLIIIWSGIWKAIALWKSARRNDLVWFIILIIFNTLGILEIIYIFIIAKDSKSEVRNPKSETNSNDRN